MKIFSWTIACVSLIACLFAVAQVNWSNLDGSGVLLDYVTKQPIVGATLTLDCREALWHGSRTIRSVQSVSSQEGRYSFKFSDTWDCDYVVLVPNKEGYKNLAGLGVPNLIISPFGAKVPRYTWMIVERDETGLRLEGWLESSRAVRIVPPGPMPMSDYMTVFSPFMESRRIASSTQEIEWVKIHYCERLAALYATTSEAEREQLANSAYGADYEIHVRPYCEARKAQQAIRGDFPKIARASS